MPRRLPPLNALRAFEAAARHLSFTNAADELHVTQGAISHQVKQLEEWLGLKLFERRGHSLTATVVGKAYAADLSRLLDALASSTERLAGDNTLAGPLRITALPSFVARWLVPRLGRFRALHPGIHLQVTSEVASHDFSRGGFELAIRLGLGRWPGLEADLISREHLSPLCSPAVLQQRPLRTVVDLQAHTLLHDQPGDLWPRWLSLAGANRSQTASAAMREGPEFNDSALVLQAAAEGHGVALGRVFLASADIAAGRLVKPFALDLPNDFSYWLVYPKAAASQPRLTAFRDWLLAETSVWREEPATAEAVRKDASNWSHGQETRPAGDTIATTALKNGGDAMPGGTSP